MITLEDIAAIHIQYAEQIIGQLIEERATETKIESKIKINMRAEAAPFKPGDQVKHTIAGEKVIYTVEEVNHQSRRMILKGYPGTWAMRDYTLIPSAPPIAVEQPKRCGTTGIKVGDKVSLKGTVHIGKVETVTTYETQYGKAVAILARLNGRGVGDYNADDLWVHD